MGSPLPDSFALWPPTPRTNGNRPATVHETNFSYSLPEDCSAATASWDPNCLSMGLPSENHNMGTNGVDMSQQYDDNSLDNNDWNRPRGGNYSSVLRNLDNDVDRLGSSYGSSSNGTSLLDPRYPYSTQTRDSDSLSLNTNFPRRLSDAASLSSADALVSASDMPYDDYSSYEGSVMTDYTHRTPISMSTTTTPLSPVMSPRQTSRISVRSGSRGRASPSPSRALNLRSAPYPTGGRDAANKRWSTGSFIPGSQASSPYIGHVDPHLQSHFHSHHSSPTCSSAHPAPQQLLLSHNHGFPRANGLLPSSYMDTSSSPHDCHSQMPNHLLVKMLQSNAAEHYRSHYTDLTEPPDLYASLNEEQIPPPPEDMDPEDPDLKPHEQELRFEGDLYTPRWVRGHGNKREGWCGICKPGRWLVLKNSAFWYDKSFTHGISAATGQRFLEPESVRRMEGNPDVWEGLCHSCKDWVALVSNKKKGTTWFRHAYKCHTHPKIKDAPKRRRESSQGKAAAAAAAAKAKVDAMNMNGMHHESMG
ncbi:hypothetical protein L873DRAFT_1682930 [Choiromyces venosus 120613-1]|uniref:Transcription regulator Rua1 C-terminal domain-containing protein n=1 Tax=Choiromyces venosus 120613-1 TaxID=1336337 RepID=A0A3N4JNP1_9PEZI|nr:hypothetical protein L873DRAFT_1682930 [Choiromyces venosus 120613-1]